MSTDDTPVNIDDLLLENRKFAPSTEFKTNSLAIGTHLYDQAATDDEGFGLNRQLNCCTGIRTGTPSVSGIFPTQSGSSVANSTSHTTV